MLLQSVIQDGHEITLGVLEGWQQEWLRSVMSSREFHEDGVVDICSDLDNESLAFSDWGTGFDGGLQPSAVIDLSELVSLSNPLSGLVGQSVPRVDLVPSARRQPGIVCLP